MDPITQGLVGAAAAGAVNSKRDQHKTALVSGFVSGTLADLDVLIRSASDPLLAVEMHRQFTHSLLFIPAGALVGAILLWPFFRRKTTFSTVYMYAFLGYATAGLLDACTSYGTQLLWPFFDSRVAWNIISVADPLVTLGLIIFISFSFIRKKRSWSAGALFWLLLFLLGGYVQQQRIIDAGLQFVESRNRPISEYTAKPTIGNRLLWRFTYISGDSIYTDGIRAGWISGITYYEGESAPRVDPATEFSEIAGTRKWEDILRFERLSDGYLAWHPDEENVLGDARYAMLPTRIEPLWGIKIDTSQPESPTPFVNIRDAGSEIRGRFTDMLLGRELTGE
jgi:inner membrane protein